MGVISGVQDGIRESKGKRGGVERGEWEMEGRLNFIWTTENGGERGGDKEEVMITSSYDHVSSSL